VRSEWDIKLARRMVVNYLLPVDDDPRRANRKTSTFLKKAGEVNFAQLHYLKWCISGIHGAVTYRWEQLTINNVPSLLCCACRRSCSTSLMIFGLSSSRLSSWISFIYPFIVSWSLLRLVSGAPWRADDILIERHSLQCPACIVHRPHDTIYP